MATTPRLSAVIDTNVLFEGVTQKGGAGGLVVEAWLAGVFRPCVSNALAYEYFEVLNRKLSEARLHEVLPLIDALLDTVEWVVTFFTWRPSSTDPADEHVVDCAMNAGAMDVTSNVRDFRLAERWLGLEVLTPSEFVRRLAEEQAGQPF